MTEQEWLNNNELSLHIWNNKYRLHEGNLDDDTYVPLETFDEWIDRVSGGYDNIKKLILEKKFSFGGRINASRGLNKLGKKITYSNCYVIAPVEDNLESIFKSAYKLARTYSYGGGCGIDVSKLRPKGSKVNNAAKSTSGCTSFMDFFSYVTGLIGQEGRRGALMLSIDCTHPDLEEFINLKSDPNCCTKANISVKVSDDFMRAVENDSDWNLEIISDSNGIISKTVKAKDIFMLLAKRNWESAEPGILYWDHIKDYNMLNRHEDFLYAGTNPCAEEPLPAGGSCLLGSINLAEFVINPFTENARIDYLDLSYTVEQAVYALNDVLEEGLELHPLEEQRNSVRDWRQIGLGTMGLGDMLIKLNIKYGSEESIKVINDVFSSIAITAIYTSLDLAEEKGCYPKCNRLALSNSSFIEYISKRDRTIQNNILKHGLYNSQLLTCAPTGSIATMYQVSGGVEPNFAFKFNRRTVSLNKEETIYKVEADIVKQYREITGNDGDLPDYFIASQDIDPMARIKVQAELQKYIDASISSTINLPESATIEDIANIYFEAWRAKLKGVTVYRDNCQRPGILTTDKNNNTNEPEEEDNVLPRGYVRKADDNCIGLKRTLTTGCGTLHCEAFFDPNNGDLLETYLSKGSKGGCNNFMIGLSRMISLAARGGLSIDDILDQLKSCGTCPSYAVRAALQKDTSKGSCCPVAVGNALKEMHKEVLQRIACCNEQITIENESTDEYEECPKCHTKGLYHSSGCVQCVNCGYSKCD